jgi:hypothetical protein
MREADNVPSSVSEINDVSSYAFTPHMSAWRGTESNFPFTLVKLEKLLKYYKPHV